MSARALLLTLMILTKDVVAIQTRMLSSTETGQLATGSHRRRHQPDDKFQQILSGSTSLADAMPADEKYKRRSVMADDRHQQQKHITNAESNTLFYEQDEEGTWTLSAYNKTPNESNSLFIFESVCMDRAFAHWFQNCDFRLHNQQNGNIFKIKRQGIDYLMCANGKRVSLVKSSSIQNLTQAEKCVWTTFDINGNLRFIYTKYANGCGKNKKNRKCRRKRAFLAIHRRKKGRTGSAGPILKVMLRYIMPPTNSKALRKFNRKDKEEFLFYLHRKNPNGQFNYFNPSHQFITEKPPTSVTSALDTSGEDRYRKRKKKAKNCNNLLQNSGCGRHRSRSGRRKKYKKPANLLDRKNYRSSVGLIWEHPFYHKSLLDNK